MAYTLIDSLRFARAKMLRVDAGARRAVAAVAIAVSVAGSAAAVPGPAPVVGNLTCEGIAEPNLIDTASPRLGWQMVSEARGVRQTAYQLRIAEVSSDGHVVPASQIETPTIHSDQSQWVNVTGFTVQPDSQYEWQVRVWDETGRDSGWSAPAHFETGLMYTRWPAGWIGDGRVVARDAVSGARYFRKLFTVPTAPVRARLYLTALGVAEPWLNGSRIGNDYFGPGWPDYRRRVFYVAYDVTSMIHPGVNALGLVLGDGWYSTSLLRTNQFGDQPVVSAVLELTNAKGEVTLVTTNPSWQWADGPVVEQSIYNGETYDAQRANPQWCTATDASTDGTWHPVTMRGVEGLAVTARLAPPTRRVEELRPASRREIRPGVFLYDMGQNMVGWVRLKVQAPAGTTVKMRFAEMLETPDTLHVANLRTARATATYIARGDPEPEVWEPHFTYFGFRYVEVSGLTSPLDDALTGVVVHSDMERIGHFECSDPLLNKLYRNTLWGQRGNFLEVPTDCPQRNERLGWTGDAQVFAHTASYNYATGTFYRQWLRTVRDGYRDDPDGACGFPDVAPDTGFRFGSAGWGDAAVIVPYIVWQHNGDRRLLEESFDSIQNWVEAQARDFPDGIRRSTRSYGDWLAPGYPPPDAPTPYVLIATAYYAHVTDLAGRIAGELGRNDAAARDRALFKHIQDAFRREFIEDDGQVVSDEQTAYLLALAFDLVPKNLRSRAIANLVRTVHAKDDHLATGFLGTPLLLPVLSATGHADLAYKVLLQQTYPGWLFPIKNGATTMWERWDSWTPDKGFNPAGMNSFNHYAYGCVVGWLYDTVAGLSPGTAGPGWKRFYVAPHPGGGLSYAKASVVTPYGTAASAWQISGDRLTLTVVVPPNTEAEITLPAKRVRDVTEEDRPLKRVREVSKVKTSGQGVSCLVPSGTYRFSMPRPPQ